MHSESWEGTWPAGNSGLERGLVFAWQAFPSTITTNLVAMRTLELVEAEARSCTKCRLADGRTQVVFGTGNPKAPLMLVGEGPGLEEDRQGEPFVGRSGRLLDMLVAQELGLDRTGLYIGNVVKCRPPNNRDPRDDEIEACMPFLFEQIAIVGPKVVITLGSFAARALLGTEQRISSLRGKVYPFGQGVVVPTYHPAYALRGGGQVVAEIRADLVRAKEELDRLSRLAGAATA